MFQVSTLQALMLGYSKGVIPLKKLVRHGDTGLGTVEDVNGELIILDGRGFRADDTGSITEVPFEVGIPFASVDFLDDPVESEIGAVNSAEQLKSILNNIIDSEFGLNSMYIVRLDGHFSEIKARSLEGQRSHHVELKEILKKNQREFGFKDIDGTVVCLYYPDYMDGINAAGWHFHFISKDRKVGGHVFDMSFEETSAKRIKIKNIEIQLPMDAAFDTYSLKDVAKDDVAAVEQSSK